MGAGLAQIGIVLVLTVIGLPLFFFGLMAALDRFERSLSAQPRTVTQQTASSPAVALPAPQADAAIVTLPVASSASSGTTSNPAAAV